MTSPSSDVMIRISSLETQLAHTSDKVKMRENVILQLEEEIKAKERLIHEQGHLIGILENEGSESRFDADSLTSDSEITIVERALCPSLSPVQSETNSNDQRMMDRLEQVMVDRERLELQNEQLLKQWEDALEYVTNVQKQLQGEMQKNSNLKSELLDLQKISYDSVVISKGLFQILSVLFVFFSYYLYML